MTAPADQSAGTWEPPVMNARLREALRRGTCRARARARAAATAGRVPVLALLDLDNVHLAPEADQLAALLEGARVSAQREFGTADVIVVAAANTDNHQLFAAAAAQASLEVFDCGGARSAADKVLVTVAVALRNQVPSLRLLVVSADHFFARLRPDLVVVPEANLRHLAEDLVAAAGRDPRADSGVVGVAIPRSPTQLSRAARQARKRRLRAARNAAQRPPTT